MSWHATILKLIEKSLIVDVVAEVSSNQDGEIIVTIDERRILQDQSHSPIDRVRWMLFMWKPSR